MDPSPRADSESTGLSPLLGELEAVLAAENQALKRLDRDALDRATENKLRLCDDIARAGLGVAAQERKRLERIRRLALKNQMLLAHARDSVRQVLTVATGQVASPALGGLRVDVRG